MKNSKIYAIALFAGTLGIIITMFFHPTGGDMLKDGHFIESGGNLAVATHSLALVSIPILFYGFFGLYKQIGEDSPLATAALVAF